MNVPGWKDWKSWTALLGTIGTVVGLVAGVPKAWAIIEPAWPASRGWVADILSPFRVVLAQNTIAIIEAKEEAIKVRLMQAGMRLLVTPNDPIVQDAWKQADEDIKAAEFDKSRAQCDLRRAQGLGCATDPGQSG